MSSSNKSTVSFHIAPGKKRKLTEKTQLVGDWPQNLKDYALAAFQHCRPGQESKLETELKEMIKLHGVTANWEQLRLPKSAGHIPNPNAVIATMDSSVFGSASAPTKPKTSLKAKSRGKMQQQKQQQQQEQQEQQQQQKQQVAKVKNKAVPTPTKEPTKPTGGIIAVELTPEELQKREMRKMRFQATKSVKPAPAESIDAASPSAESQSSTDWESDRVVGLCTDLEKPYFRLTSAPDPSTVRTPDTLKKTFDILNKRWKSDPDYSYICDQFKSLRQDLTVQHIVNEFTVKVYEAHARIALEMGDLGEYNQCQSQVMQLYRKGIQGQYGEFVAYQILYMLFSENHAELNSLMEKLEEAHIEGRNMGKTSKTVKHAMSVRIALARGDYHNFFKLYHSAPNRSRFLMDKFMDRERAEALKMLCKAFPMGLPFDFIEKELAFYSTTDLVAFLNSHGVYSTEGDTRLNTKAALPYLIEYSRKYRKVDIKGQI